MSDSLTNFTIKRSTDGGLTFPDLVGTVSPGEPYTIDDSTPIPDPGSLTWEVLQTTLNGVVIPYSNASASGIPGGGVTLAEDIELEQGDLISNDYITCTAIDSTRAIWFAGIYNDPGQPFMFVGKMYSDGTVLFINRYQGPGGGPSLSTLSITADASGNAYFTGWFQNSIDFGGGHVIVGEDITVSTTIFVAKFSSEGQCVGARAFPGVGNPPGTSNVLLPMTGYGITLDYSGHVIVTGNFINALDFGSGYSFNSPGRQSIFVLKLDRLDLSTVWAFALLGTGGEFGPKNSFGYGVCVDQNDNIFICGAVACVLGTTTDFKGVSGDSIIVSAQNGGTEDAYLAKYNSDGQLQWVNSFGGRFRNASNAVAVDAVGNPTVAGYYRFTMNAGGGNVTAANYDSFIVQFRATDGAYVWGYYPQTNSSSDNFQNVTRTGFLSVATDSDGNVIGCGINFGNPMFDTSATSPGTVAAQIKSSDGHAFIVKYSNAGAFRWAYADGAASSEAGMCVSAQSIDGEHIGGHSIVYGGTFFCNSSNPFNFHNSAPIFVNGTPSGVGSVLIGALDNNQDGFILIRKP